MISASMTLDRDGIDGPLALLTVWGTALAMTNGALYGLAPFITIVTEGGAMSIIAAGGCRSSGYLST